MIDNMWKKLTGLALLTILIFHLIVPTINRAEGLSIELPWWNSDWKFREIIEIPTENSLNLSNYPIDTKIKFSNKCWTKSEEKTSIRICQWNGKKWQEIEFQIYNLKFLQENFIEECNVVFLLPEKFYGNEIYYAYYDDEEKPELNYLDRVEVEEKFLYQEPIPGQKINVKFYAIKQENYYIYYVAQEGELLGQTLSQSVVKLLDKTEVISPSNLEQMAQFCYSYYYGPTDEYFSSSSQKLVSKSIDIDGNLMVRFTLTSSSYKGEIITKNTYTYYYCRGSDERIFVKVRHEILKDLTLPDCIEYWDGSYANILSFKVRSKTIKELNFGNIPSYLKIYSEDDTIKEFKLDKNPSKIDVFLTTKDEIDLGKEAWICVEESNKSYAIILSSNESIVKKGKNENDGVQIKGLQVELLNMLGLEADFTQVHMMRNAYEDKFYDKEIPKDFLVEFNAEFFTSHGSYKKLREESEAFQSLIRIDALENENQNYSNKEQSRLLSLTLIVHAAPSFPLGNLLSIITGRNFSYISAELYSEKELLSKSIAARIKTYPAVKPEDKNLSFLKKFKTYFSLLDFKNLSLFKKVVFDNIPEGKYVLKIYREYPALKKEREIIGLEVIDLRENTTKNIYCSKERSISLTVCDQNKKGVENAKAVVILDDYPVIENITDKDGRVLINLPCKEKTMPYKLKVFYKGFKIYEKDFNLKSIKFKPPEFFIKISLNSLKFVIKDLFDLPPGVKLTPTLKSFEAEYLEVMEPSHVENNVYTFDNLYPSIYEFEVNYKRFKVQKKIGIPSDKDIIYITFPAEFSVKINVFDSYGMPLGKTCVTVSRDKKSLECETDDEGTIHLSLPPGEYTAESFDNEIRFNVSGEGEIDFVTEKTPVILNYLTIIFTSLSLLLVIFFLFKKIPLKSFIKIVPITLLILAIVLPWWQLRGINDNPYVREETNIYPLSQKIVSKIKTDSYNYLSLSRVPYVVDQFLMIVLLILIACILFISISIFFDILNKTKIENAVIFSSLLSLIFVIALFIYGTNELSKFGIGSIIGSGTVDVALPYSSEYVEINASWSLSYGFYLCILVILILILQIILTKKLHKGS